MRCRIRGPIIPNFKASYLITKNRIPFNASKDCSNTDLSANTVLSSTTPSIKTFYGTYLKNFKVSTYNVRTLFQIGKFHQLCLGCSVHKIDFTAIQEHRWITKNEIDQITNDNYNYTLYYSSADSGRNGGVGILVHKKHCRYINYIKKISPRIIAINLYRNPSLTIISIYAPTNISEPIEKDKFYDELEMFIHNLPAHDVILTAGDFNARVGCDQHMNYPKIIGKHVFHQETNDNGTRLVSLCESASLRPAQFRFPHPIGRIWTWMHPSGKKAQIDHILIRAKWFNSLRNCRSYSSIELDSDHRIVTASIKVSLRRQQPQSIRRMTPNWSVLTTDTSLQRAYAIKIKNYFDILTVADDDSVQSDYDAFIGCFEEANKLIPTKKKRKYNWISQESEQLRQQRDTAKKRYQISKTSKNYQYWRNCNNELSKSYQNDKVVFYENICGKLTTAASHNNIKEVYNHVNILSGKSKTNTAGLVKKLDGSAPKSFPDLINEWEHYFSNLLNVKNESKEDIETITHNNPISQIYTGKFTLRELITAIKYLKNNKSTGTDCAISSEALKYGGIKANQKLLKICNKVYDRGKPPDEWITNIIIPIPKKGNGLLMSNYRGISLMSIAAKTYNRMILNRIYPEINKKLKLNQAGFRKNMNCAQQISILRRILEGSKLKRLPLIATFVDFAKAFDSIDREALWKILHSYGLPEKIVNGIKILYNNSNGVIKIGNSYSKKINITSGILQGDTLAPFLFIIVLDYALRKIPNELGFRSHNSPSKYIADLEFADDVVLLASTQTDAQTQLNILSTETAKLGLKININKTKTMAKNIPEPKVFINENKLECVLEYKYLGSYISSSMKDFLARKSLAWKVFWDIKKVWSSRVIHIEQKIRIYKSTCIPIILYGCESWIMSTEMKNKMNAFATSCYRYILGIRQIQKIKVTEILKQVNMLPLHIIAQRRQLSYIGKILRENENSLAKTYIFYEPELGNRNRGRQPLTFNEYIKELTCKRNLQDLTVIAQNVKQWEEFLFDCTKYIDK